MHAAGTKKQPSGADVCIAPATEGSRAALGPERVDSVRSPTEDIYQADVVARSTGVPSLEGAVLPKSDAPGVGDAAELCTVKDTVGDPPTGATRTRRTLAPQKCKKKKRARMHAGIGVVAPSGMHCEGASGAEGVPRPDGPEDLMSLTDPLASNDAALS